jgi:hypothetical protein
LRISVSEIPSCLVICKSSAFRVFALWQNFGARRLQVVEFVYFAITPTKFVERQHPGIKVLTGLKNYFLRSPLMGIEQWPSCGPFWTPESAQLESFACKQQS